MKPIDATNCLTLDDLRPLALEEAADDPAILGAVIRHTPGEWDTTMGRLIESTMRDFLDDAPMRVTVEYLTPDEGDWMRLTGELVALTADGDAVFLGGDRGQNPTQRKTIPLEDIYTLAF
ncbi:UNVERIFIED_ORG: hypothetical protein EDC92_12416 [Dietzia maris]|uniref:hypothetical protein n=1 Tax=Dietzia maris TaxID=37915 RepID=UPI0010492E6C